MGLRRTALVETEDAGGAIGAGVSGPIDLLHCQFEGVVRDGLVERMHVLTHRGAVVHEEDHANFLGWRHVGDGAVAVIVVVVAGLRDRMRLSAHDEGGSQKSEGECEERNGFFQDLSSLPRSAGLDV